MTPSRLVRIAVPRPPSREVAVLAAVAFSVAVGFGVVAPVIPEFARTFGGGRTAAGAIVSIFAFMRFVSAIGGGRLVNRLGERRVLALGIGIVGVSSALAGIAQSYGQLLVLRGAGGVGSAMFTVSAASIVLRSTPAGLRSRAVGVYTGGFLLGGIAGPGVGSLVAPLGLRAPFFLYAGTLLVAGSIGLAALPKTPLAEPPTEPGAAASGLPLGAAFRQRGYRAALAANFADTWAVLGVRSTLIPLFVTDVLRQPKTWTYNGLLVVSLVSGLMLLPAGRYADTRGRRPMLVGGLVTMAAAMSVLAVSRTLPAYLIAMVVLGVGSGMLHVAPAAVVGDIAGGRSGTTVAAFQMAGDAGSIAGPLVAGRLADTVSYGAAFGATAGVLLAATVVAVTAPETRR